MEDQKVILQTLRAKSEIFQIHTKLSIKFNLNVENNFWDQFANKNNFWGNFVIT